MAKTVTVPIKVVRGVEWADLSAMAPTHTHQVCAEIVNPMKDISFAGGHRVRLFGLKKSVHWRVPTGIDVDISAVPEAPEPKAPVRRHAKR
jgi:hypothetical protein